MRESTFFIAPCSDHKLYYPENSFRCLDIFYMYKIVRKLFVCHKGIKIQELKIKCFFPS